MGIDDSTDGTNPPTTVGADGALVTPCATGIVPMNRDEFNRFFQQGRFDLPGLPTGMMDAFQRSAYNQGKRLRTSGKPAASGSGPKQTLGEAINVAFALAGAAAGTLLGLRRVGAEEGTWTGVLVLLILGVIAGSIVIAVIRAVLGKIRMSLLWRRGADERDVASLIDMWGAIHDEVILPHLLMEIDDEGRAWTMDGKGSFYFKLRSGRLLTVRPTAAGGMTVELSGRGQTEEEAYLVMMAHRSAGNESAAQLAMVRIDGYTPDTKALKVLESMRRNERIHPLELPDE